MNTGIIVCTRLDSKRLPGKAALKINGKTILNHLHDRLLKFNTKIIYAVPAEELQDYRILTQDFEGDFNLFTGKKEDPLNRMNEAAKLFDLDTVVRVTHDKIFLCDGDFIKCLDTFHKKNLDYLYSSDFTPGSSMELISAKALDEAATKFKNVEHISYSIKAITENQYNMPLKGHRKNQRLLIDFPEDIDLMTAVFAVLGNECTLQDVLYFLLENQWCSSINKKPKVTVYTCCYNHVQYIEQCMQSVASQKDFLNYNYILIDDKSTDGSQHAMAEFASKYPNVKYIRNNENMGLASSSNIAIAQARGDYVFRLDSDDFLTDMNCLYDMLGEIKHRNSDLLYPNNYYGDRGTVQKGKEQHHAGGCLMGTKALSHVKFTNGLRGYDSLDIFVRAQKQLKIAYYNKPVFLYRQHDKSMSKNDLQMRSEIKKDILNGSLEKDCRA